MNQLKKGIYGTATLALVLMGTSASAESFARGTANTDLLYHDFGENNFVLSTGIAYVTPKRNFETLMGAEADLDPFSDNFTVPSFSLGAKLTENVSCVLSYAEPFGVDGTFSEDAQMAEAVTAILNGDDPNPTSYSSFIAKEYAATCGYQMPMGPGRFHVLGGVYYQTFDYTEETWIGTVHLHDDGQWGYRLGAAYDIPDYALRVEVMYRSEATQKGVGDFAVSELGASYDIPDGLPANGSGTMPQSVSLRAQSGIAPTWMLFGSVKWTDWSVLPGFAYDVTGLGTSSKVFNYQDGWTVEFGVGHQLTETLSGAVQIGWDKGVGTGADISTDTWTLAAGLEYETDYGTIGLAGGVSLLTGGAQTTANESYYDATAGDDVAPFLSLTHTIAF